MEATNAQTNDLERRIDLSIAIARSRRISTSAFAAWAKNVKMPGFRPGKVPFNIVKQQYGDQARHEVLSEALDRAFGDAVVGQKLRVAGYPRIEPKTTESTTHLEFLRLSSRFIPEFTPGDMAVAEIERPTLEVGAAEVDKTLDILRSSASAMKTRPAPPPPKTESSSTSSAKGRRTLPGRPGQRLSLHPRPGPDAPRFRKCRQGLKTGESRPST